MAPVALLPAHSAPLDMLFYDGAMFPELLGKLLISFHGYRETGHRIVSLDLDSNFIPIEDSLNEIINNWARREGFNPKGAPVGMEVAHDGSLWFVEDKNKTVMVLLKSDHDAHNTVTTLNFNNTLTKLTSLQKTELTNIQKNIFFKNCLSCHKNLNQETPHLLWEELNDSGWINLSLPLESVLLKRVIGNSEGRQMPLNGNSLNNDEINAIKKFLESLIVNE